MSSFGATLTRLAEAAAGSPAVTCDGETLTHADLLHQVRRVAGLLADRGVRPGDSVLVSLPNSVEFVVALFATWWLGATPQPIPHRLSETERDAIIELATPRLIVGLPTTGPTTVPHVSRAELVEAALTGAATAREPKIAPVWKMSTSGGSTGRPKLIESPQPATTELVAALAAIVRMPEGGTVLVTAPLTHSAPFTCTVAGLLTGGHVVLMRRFDPTEALRLVERHRVAWAYLVPTMMHRIWRLPDEERRAADLSSVEVVFHMAAPCPRWLKRAWIDWLGADRLYELYGGTELQAATVISGTEWLAHPGSVGRPVIGEVQCRDEHGKPAPPGVIGELWLRRGPGKAAPYRYVGAAPKRAEDGWESLGDHGYVDADGYVYVTDRDTDMIVVGGANVYPAEIEAAIDEHPAVRSSCVIGLPDEDLGSVPHLIVELSDVASDEDILAFAAERLAPHKLPRSVERVDHPLRDDAGKVRRSAMRSARLAGTPVRCGAG